MRQLIYPAPPVAVGPPPRPLAEVVLPVGRELEIIGWHNLGDGLDSGRPALAFFHGNGENLETMRQAGFFDRLLALELSFLAVDYPGYGRSGGVASEAGVKAAAEAVLDWLVERHAKRWVVVCGWSLGAAVAIHLAAARGEEVRGLVALSPWTSLIDVAADHFPRWLLSFALRESYDSLAVAGQISCPSLIVHGAGDRIIRAVHSERLAAALPAARRVLVERAGHNDLMDRAEVWRQIDGFVSGLGAPVSL